MMLTETQEMTGAVSARLWIYFAVMMPLTGVVVGAWFAFDKISRKNIEEGLDGDFERMGQLDTRMTEHIAKRVGARVMTGDLADMDAERERVVDRRPSMRLRALTRQATEALSSSSATGMV
jgi:hypothetical protein